MPPRDPLEYQPQQQGMVVVVLEALPRGTFDPGQTEGGPTEVRRVVRARLVIREEEEPAAVVDARRHHEKVDRKSTRLNSSHLVISYAVFCLKKKKTKRNLTTH